MKILIVEDNEVLSNNISKYLELEWIASSQLFSWEKVNYELQNHDYDGVIMDLWLWEYSGIEVIETIRESGKNIPILILTARDTIKDKIAWFHSGADDYLTKPFNYEELILRIQALVKRNYSLKWENIILENIEINTAKKEVIQDGKIIHLSKIEYELLYYLVSYKGKVVTKKELLEKVWWEYDDFFPSRTVDIYVWYLRKKLKKDLIQTVRWEWYLIN